MKIESVNVSDAGAEILFHVMPGGHMLCSVAGVDLRPTPGWLCREVAIQAAQKSLEQKAANCGIDGCGQSPIPMQPDRDHLYREGLRALHERAPLVLDLPYDLLHSNEKGSS